MRMTESELAKAFGLPAPEADEPQSPAEAAMADIDDLDKRLEKLVSAQQLPGETFEKATDRFLQTNPRAFEMHKTAKLEALRHHGVGQATE
ncbi:MAG TPA: hypothetical protein VGG79_02240 [Roseiarcus sp.]|jgi:hypothetical protein